MIRGLQRFSDMQFRTELDGVDVVVLAPGLASANSHFRTHLSLPDGKHHEFSGVIT